jgi:hypothetical protein
LHSTHNSLSFIFFSQMTTIASAGVQDRKPALGEQLLERRAYQKCSARIPPGHPSALAMADCPQTHRNIESKQSKNWSIHGVSLNGLFAIVSDHPPWAAAAARRTLRQLHTINI